ncbi:MAG: IclR family transcriptional regulator [Rhodoferax sp.]|nr:IclR family transcriptional regulator [Rhodoferax sp.]
MSLDRRYIVAPVHKSMQLLDALVSGKEPMALSDLAASTALPKTTAFRYLYTLRASGFVTYDERTERYAIGPRVAVASPLPGYAARIKEIAQPAMLRLQRQFNETVNLGIRDGTDIIYIDMVGSSRLLHAEAKIGKRDPLHSTALGKAILLTLGMSEIDRAVPRRMVARTPYTITDREHFLDDIARSAARKYALDLEENEVGARCVAAAITEPSGRGAMAAISISGPCQLMSDDMLARMGRVLAGTAGSIDISSALN